MSNIGSRVWKTMGTNYIIRGIVIEEKLENKWLMVKVDWFIPHKDFEIDEWQKLKNLGRGEI